MVKKFIPLTTKAKARTLIRGGFSRRQVAKKCGIGKSSVSRWGSWVKIEGDDDERLPPPLVKTKTACTHGRVQVPGNLCLSCGAVQAPPPSPVRPEIPDWLQGPGPNEIPKRSVEIRQPFWGLETNR